MRLPSVPTTGPSVEPISQADAKVHLRITGTDDDDLVDRHIAAARQQIEHSTRRQLITATWTGNLDAFPGGDTIRIPRPPLQTITSIKYYDLDGVQQTLANTTYDVDTTSEPGRVTLAYGESWPSARMIQNAIEVIFVAGFGDAATDVPEGYIQTLCLTMGYWYDPLAAVRFSPIGNPPVAIQNLLNPLTIPEYD